MAADPLIQRYLAAAEHELARAPVDRERILAELEAHLEDAVDRLRRAGCSEDEAARMALERCGSTAALVGAVHDNEVKGTIMEALSRWTGRAGVLAAVTGFAGVLVWSWGMFVATMLLAAVAVAGLLARHWSAGPLLVGGSAGLFVAANVAAGAFPPAEHGFALGMALPALLVLASVLAFGSVLHRAAIVPRPAIWIALAGLAVAIAANVAGRGAEQGAAALVQNGATLVALAGWLWMNAALALRSGPGERAAAVS